MPDDPTFQDAYNQQINANKPQAAAVPVAAPAAAPPAASGTPNYLTQDLSKDNPLPWQRYFDDSATQAANAAADRNKMGIHSDGTLNENGYLAQTLNHGVPGSAAPLKATAMGAVSDSPMSEAITNKYSTQSDKALTSFKSQQAIQQQAQASNEMNQSTNQLGTMKKLELQNYKEQYDYQQKRAQLLLGYQIAQQNAKMSIFSSAIGAGGSILGAAAAGAFKGGGGGGGGSPGGGSDGSGNAGGNTGPASDNAPSYPMPGNNGDTSGNAYS